VACVGTARLWITCYPRRMPERGLHPAEPEGGLIEVGGDPFPLSGDEDPDSPEERAPRSRTKTIVLSSLLAVGLAGAAVIGYSAWRIASQKDATLTAPAEVAGLHLDTSSDGKDTGDYLRTALSAEVDLDDAVGAVYTDGNSKQDVLFFGGTTLIWTPGDDLQTAFGLISDNQGAVTDLHSVSAGELGGTMKCGTTKTDDGTMAVCGWADHGSLALAMFPNRTVPDAAKLMVQIRDEAQTRN
jgi:hypothetical protein